MVRIKKHHSSLRVIWWIHLYVSSRMQIISDYVYFSVLLGRVVLFPVLDVAQVYLLAPRKRCSS